MRSRRCLKASRPVLYPVALRRRMRAREAVKGPNLRAVALFGIRRASHQSRLASALFTRDRRNRTRRREVSRRVQLAHDTCTCRVEAQLLLPLSANAFVPSQAAPGLANFSPGRAAAVNENLARPASLTDLREHRIRLMHRHDRQGLCDGSHSQSKQSKNYCSHHCLLQQSSSPGI